MHFLVIFLITACEKSDKQTGLSRPDIQGLISLAENIQYTNSDTALTIAKNAYQLSLQSEYLPGLAQSTELMGSLLYQMGGFSPAITQLNISLGAYEQLGNTKGQANINVLLGKVYQRSGNHTQAFLFQHRAMQLFNEINDDFGKATVYGNLGHLYEKTQAYDSALLYQKKALSYHQLARDSSGLADIHDNIGSIYEDLNLLEQAQDHFQIALAINRKNDNHAASIVNLNNIGDTYRKLEDYTNALKFSSEALKLAESSLYNYQIKSACRDLSKTYEALGKSDLALQFLTRSYEITDDIFSEQIAAEIAKTQAVYELEQKQQRIAILEKERSFIRSITWLSSLGVMVFLCLGGMIFYQQKSKNVKKRKLLETEADLARIELENMQLSEQKLKTELENKILKEDQLQQELDLKSKSLTKNALHMIQKNEFLHEVRGKLKDVRKATPDLMDRRIKKLIKSIDYSFNLDDDWQEFETVFQQAHSEFFDKLKMLYPNLSPAEVRLCAMIRLNLHSKDMSAIMGISSDSLRISRYRLRKKLGLNKGSNLYTFILNIG
ncbi:MAG: tetratricopeptide repeat protein [Marinoscillum sp.]